MLLEFDPETKQTTCLVDGLWFANGVAMPASGEFVLVVQSHRFSISKYWLAGARVRSAAAPAFIMPHLHVSNMSCASICLLAAKGRKACWYACRLGLLKR